MRLSPVFNRLRALASSDAPAAQQLDPVNQLSKLADMLEKDLLTREEFDSLKAELLGKQAATGT